MILGRDLAEELPRDCRLALSERVDHIDALSKRGRRLWVPQQKDPTQGVQRSVLQLPTRIQRGQSREGQRGSSEVVVKGSKVSLN